ncbi:hypothetical protein HYQ46_000262 [Verticillium longisporum]|nr:hypothetical protein HYQ46_000262 [Verticillium longisporum]
MCPSVWLQIIAPVNSAEKLTGLLHYAVLDLPARLICQEVPYRLVERSAQFRAGRFRNSSDVLSQPRLGSSRY